MPASLANSSGIFLGGSAHLDLVRPGVALYGGNPTPGKPNPMKPVVELKVRIVQLRDVEVGETVGYDATWTARTTSRASRSCSIGYADGYLPRPRGGKSMTNVPARHGWICGGKPCPFVGRVSMDLIALDVHGCCRPAA